MAKDDETAALIAEAREKAHAIMALLRHEGIDARPENDLIMRLAAALSRATADAARMREACKAADEVLTSVHDCAEWWHGEQPDEEYIIRADNGRLHVLQAVAKQCPAALEPRQQEQDQ